MKEAIYELHMQERERGQVTAQLYERTTEGALTLVDRIEVAPFDNPQWDLAHWLRRMVLCGRLFLS